MSKNWFDDKLKDILVVAIKACEAAGKYLSENSSQNNPNVLYRIRPESAKYFVKYVELGRRLRAGLKEGKNTSEDIESAKCIYKFYVASKFYKSKQENKFAQHFAQHTLVNHCVSIYGECLEPNIGETQNE